MASSKLPILMYHNIEPREGSGLTISVPNFEAQCAWLASNGYATHHFSELLKTPALAAKKNCVITFDDGYVNQLDFAVPILRKYNLKATFFIPLAYLGATDAWNTAQLPIMTAKQVRALPSDIIELAFHSFEHKKYDELSAEAISEDTKKCFDLVEKEALSFTNVVAYPYGKFPRKNPEHASFVNVLMSYEIKLGLRIGNRIASFPFKNKFEINRIDVKGAWSLTKFRRKLRQGKLF